MSKVTAICGKVGSGKTYYAQKLLETQQAILLSNDELLHDVLPNTHPGDQKDLMERINRYLMKKAVELVKCGCDVILDWGFWKKEERVRLTQYFVERRIPIEWVYTRVNDDVWKKNIEKRNGEIEKRDDGSSFYLNEEILERANRLFEPPEADEGMIVVE